MASQPGTPSDFNAVAAVLVVVGSILAAGMMYFAPILFK